MKQNFFIKVLIWGIGIIVLMFFIITFLQMFGLAKRCYQVPFVNQSFDKCFGIWQKGFWIQEDTYTLKGEGKSLFPQDKSLSDEQTLQIVKKVISNNLNVKTDPACLVFNNKKIDGNIVYEVTKKFTNNCPGDPTSAPTIPSIRIDLKTGQIFLQSLDGEYRSINN